MNRVNIDFDVLDAFTLSFLESHKIQFKREMVNSALTHYHLDVGFLGKLGEIHLRKLSDNYCEVKYSHSDPIDILFIPTFLRFLGISNPRGILLSDEEFIDELLEDLNVNSLEYLGIGSPEELTLQKLKEFGVEVTEGPDPAIAVLEGMQFDVKRFLRKYKPCKYLNIYSYFPDFPDIKQDILESLTPETDLQYRIYTAIETRCMGYINKKRYQIMSGIKHEHLAKLAEEKSFPSQASSQTNLDSRRGRGGPKGTPEEEKRRILEEWNKARLKNENQEVFCYRNGISVATLGRWRRELDKNSKNKA
jgi:hypothetical protein